MSHGGARAGAGRPKGSKTRRSRPTAAPRAYSDVLDYLQAVALGEAPADAIRVAAAKACLPYQKPRTRAPVESPSPRKIAANADRAATAAHDDEWSRKADAIRERVTKRKSPHENR